MEGAERVKIERIVGDFTVCQVPNLSSVNLDAAYCFVGKTDEEKSLVCLTQDVPENTLAREDGWRAFRIAGALDFSLIGILARISAVLSAAGIGIFAVSTYNTDYIFVKKDSETRAITALKDAGYEIAE